VSEAISDSAGWATPLTSDDDFARRGYSMKMTVPSGGRKVADERHVII